MCVIYACVCYMCIDKLTVDGPKEGLRASVTKHGHQFIFKQRTAVFFLFTPIDFHIVLALLLFPNPPSLRPAWTSRRRRRSRWPPFFCCSSCLISRAVFSLSITVSLNWRDLEQKIGQWSALSARPKERERERERGIGSKRGRG